MAIKYTVVSKRPGGMAGEHDPRYYPVLCDRRVTDLRAVCKTISGRSAFASADVMGVVQALIQLVPELLMDGRNVKLDGLGTFSVHASGSGHDDPSKVTLRDIKKLKLTFLPDKRIKQQLRQATFEKAKRK